MQGYLEKGFTLPWHEAGPPKKYLYHLLGSEGLLDFVVDALGQLVRRRLARHHDPQRLGVPSIGVKSLIMNKRRRFLAQVHSNSIGG